MELCDNNTVRSILSHTLEFLLAFETETEPACPTVSHMLHSWQFADVLPACMTTLYSIFGLPCSSPKQASKQRCSHGSRNACSASAAAAAASAALVTSSPCCVDLQGAAGSKV